MTWMEVHHFKLLTFYAGTSAACTKQVSRIQFTEIIKELLGQIATANEYLAALAVLLWVKVGFMPCAC